MSRGLTTSVPLRLQERGREFGAIDPTVERGSGPESVGAFEPNTRCRSVRHIRGSPATRPVTRPAGRSASPVAAYDGRDRLGGHHKLSYRNQFKGRQRTADEDP